MPHLKGHIPWNKGLRGVYKTSEETKKKMSEIMKRIGNKPPVISYWLGKKRSLKDRLKMGHRVWTEEQRKKIGEIQIGKKQSETTRKKRSETLKGEEHPNWKGGYENHLWHN